MMFTQEIEVSRSALVKVHQHSSVVKRLIAEATETPVVTVYTSLAQISMPRGFGVRGGPPPLTPNTVFVIFSEEPSEQEKGDAESVVEDFDGSNPWAFKIYGFAAQPFRWENREAIPWDLDFKTDLTITPAKKTLPKIKGRPTKVEYYESCHPEVDGNGDPVVNPTTGFPNMVYENKICEIEFDLTYDNMGLITDRSLKLRWVRNNGELEPTYKELGRSYDPLLDAEFRLQEGQTRRQSVVNTISMTVFGLLIQGYSESLEYAEIKSLASGFFAQYEGEFSSFVAVESTDILDALQTAEDEWLDWDIEPGVTIRMYLLDQLQDDI